MEAESVCGSNRMHYDQAMPFRQTSLLTLLFLPCFSVGQDRDLNNTIDDFKGMSGQLKDQVPGLHGEGALGNLTCCGASRKSMAPARLKQAVVGAARHSGEAKKGQSKRPRQKLSAKSKPAVKRPPVAVVVKAQPMITQPAVIPTQPHLNP